MALDAGLVGRSYPPSAVYEVGRAKIAEFATAVGAADVVLADPDVALDYSRVVHGEQRFTHHRPIRAGDRLVSTTTIETVRSIGGNDLLTTRVDVVTEDGEAVCTATSLLVARGTA